MVNQRFPRDVNGATVWYVVDRVDIADSTSVQRESNPSLVVSFPHNFAQVTVPHLQVKQAVVIQIVKETDLEANGPNASPAEVLPPIFPIFNVTLSPQVAFLGKGGPLFLKCEYAYTDFGLLTDILSIAVKGDIDKSIREKFYLAPVFVNLSPVADVLKRPVMALEAGITCDTEGYFVALRILFDEYNYEDLNPDFFRNDPERILQQYEGWAMMLDARLLVNDVRTKIMAGLGGSGKFKLESGPSVAWNPSLPGVFINLGGEAVDACVDLDLDINVDINVRLLVPDDPNTHLPMENVLRTGFYFDVSTSNILEDIGCTTLMTLFWPFMGGVLLDDDKINVLEYMAGLALGAIVLIPATIAVLNNPASNMDDLTKKLGSNCKKLNDETYECDEHLNLLLPGVFSRMHLRRVSGMARGPVFGGGLSFPAVAPRGKILDINVAEFGWTLSGNCKGGFFIDNKAQIALSIQGQVLVDADPKKMIVDDPLGEFEVTIYYGLLATILIDIRPHFKPDYVAHPYPCRIHLFTSDGVRYITIVNTPQSITPEESIHLNKLLASSNRMCAIVRDAITMPSRELKWFTDPRPEWREQLHVWQVVASDLDARTRLTIKNSDGETVMWAQPSAKGAVHMTVLFEGALAPTVLTLAWEGPETDRALAAPMFVEQFLFTRKSVIATPKTLTGVSLARDGKNILLTYSADGHEYQWNVTTPNMPTMFHMATASCTCDNHKEEGSVAADRISEAIQAIRPQMNYIRTAGLPKIKGFKQTMFVGSERGGSFFDVSNPRQPVEIQKHFQKPWFEHAVACGKLIARYNVSEQNIEIYEMEGSHVI